MTVAELIAKLQTLDQTKNIWVNYDCGYSVFPPVVEDVNENSYGFKEPMEKGDYVINAG